MADFTGLGCAGDEHRNAIDQGMSGTLRSAAQGSSRVRGVASRARLGDVDSLDVTDVRNRLSQALEEVGPVACRMAGEPGLRLSGPKTMSAPSGITDESGGAPEGV